MHVNVYIHVHVCSLCSRDYGVYFSVCSWAISPLVVRRKQEEREEKAREGRREELKVNPDPWPAQGSQLGLD